MRLKVDYKRFHSIARRGISVVPDMHAYDVNLHLLTLAIGD